MAAPAERAPLVAPPPMAVMVEPLVMRTPGVEMTPPVSPGTSRHLSLRSGATQGLDADLSANLCCPSALSCCLGSCCFCVWCGCCLRTVNQNQHAAVMVWGKYVGSVMKPGLHIVNPFGTEFRLASIARVTMDVNWIKVTDAKGNPILMRGFLEYRVSSVKKACVDTTNVYDYVHQQAPMTLRKVASQFTYDAIRTDSDGTVREKLREYLQDHVRDIGIEVMHFDITDLTYAPEIMQAMLAKQAADAMVEARRLITSAAVGMACDCAEKVNERGEKLSEAGEEKLIRNVMTIVCSHSGVS